MDRADGEGGWRVGPDLRAPGHYAVIDGVEHYVLVTAADHVTIAGPSGPIRYAMDDLADLRSVGVRAVWRGGQVAVRSVSGGRAELLTNDRALAEREGLFGDFRDGWYAEASADELSDVVERVSSIHPKQSAHRTDSSAGGLT